MSSKKRNRDEQEEELKLRIFQVDAFTDEPFGGNPAAVVLIPFGVF